LDGLGIIKDKQGFIFKVLSLIAVKKHDVNQSWNTVLVIHPFFIWSPDNWELRFREAFNSSSCVNMTNSQWLKL
jgi:hypothetical protein